MSIKIMKRVWEDTKLKGSERLVLLALAGYANDMGECFPSLETISRKVNISRRQTIRVIDNLVAKKYLEKETRTRKDNKSYTSNLYTFMLPSDKGIPSKEENVQSLNDTAISLPSDTVMSPPSDKTMSPLERKLTSNKEKVFSKSENTTPPGFVDAKSASTKGKKHSGLLEKVNQYLLDNGREPDESAITESIAFWKARVDYANENGATWHYSNLDAILEIYDTLVSSRDAMIGTQNKYIRPVAPRVIKANDDPIDVTAEIRKHEQWVELEKARSNTLDGED